MIQILIFVLLCSSSSVFLKNSYVIAAKYINLKENNANIVQCSLNNSFSHRIDNINIISTMDSSSSISTSASTINTMMKIEKQLFIGKSYNVLLDRGQQKRFIFILNIPGPLFINFSTLPQGLIWNLYLNQTVNLTRNTRPESKEIFFVCASKGHYDLFLISQSRISTEIKISDKHPFANWTFFNRSVPIKIHFQNRMQKKQMIIKWSKSQLDIHAIHYCLIVNTKQSYKNLCQAANEYFNNLLHKNYNNCNLDYFYSSNLWLRQRERIKKIEPDMTTIICTGSKSQQIIKGFIPHNRYYIDVFGIHTKLRNLPFLLKSTAAWFNRTHPNQLIEDTLLLGKISTTNSISVFSFKIPNSLQSSTNNLHIIILPCGGSQIDVKILKQRNKVKWIKDVYKPTYITQTNIQIGERYIIRIVPSTDDEILRANKVGIVVTTKYKFKNFPRLPTNTSLFEIRSVRNCRSTTIAWYSTSETRRFRYCVIVFHFSNNNRSFADYTNYCMDFGKKITNHSNFYWIRCFEPNQRQKVEHFPLLNLSPGESYLIYVTINLLEGKSLPYESLRINMNKNCYDDLDAENMYWKNNSCYDC